MELSRALAAFPLAETNQPVAGSFSGLAYNSKTLKRGELFFCLRGKKTDGHQFAAEAVDAGAAALVVEEFLPLPVLQIRVPDSRRALARLSRLFYGDPAARLRLVGVTGTNGKTTTTFFIRSVLQQLGSPVGLIGTVFNQLAGPPIPSELTTPESVDLVRLFRQALDEGCPWMVMEVSSHALAMGRVEPADFDLAVVTNITRDHFEFHGTFEHYFASKARLVREMTPERKPGCPKACILNADDPQVMRMAEGLEIPVITFGLERPADLRATDLDEGLAGTGFTLHLPGASPVRVRLPLPGAFNVANALAAAAVGWQAGVPLQGIVRGLEGCPPVPGRVEAVDEGQPFHVLVDFAHNPDALAKLVSLRPTEPGGRTILIFGAEGGKDRGKRPQMGEAARGADYVIITSDNMHAEEPLEVAAQIAAGLGERPHEIIPDRREAIARGVELARPGDLLIIAGKGHEQTWVWQGKRIPFDDRAVVRELIRERRGAAR
ncbi:MAG: UDP-N-acetylmuramoyl-L-alanyl-D-glutamate--2,6-diaminopimelate ligase [Bacillota bacterium]